MPYSSPVGDQDCEWPGTKSLFWDWNVSHELPLPPANHVTRGLWLSGMIDAWQCLAYYHTFPHFCMYPEIILPFTSLSLPK